MKYTEQEIGINFKPIKESIQFPISLPFITMRYPVMLFLQTSWHLLCGSTQRFNANKLAMFSLGFWVDQSKINKNLKRKHLLEVIFLLIVIVDQAQFQHKLISNSSPFYHLIDTAMETWLTLKSSVCGLQGMVQRSMFYLTEF